MKKFINNYLDIWVLCNQSKLSFQQRKFLNIFDILYAILLFPIYLVIICPINWIIKKVIYRIED